MERPLATRSQKICQPCRRFPTFSIFTYSKRRKQLQWLKSRSPGPDELSATLLKCSRLETVEVITVMFNAILVQGFIRTQWKGASITPIPKVSHPTTPSDYRRISDKQNATERKQMQSHVYQRKQGHIGINNHYR